MQLEGRTALVTGGAKRVGLAIARALAEAGCDLILHYAQSEAEARAAAEEIRRTTGRSVTTLQADFTDSAATEAFLKQLETECGAVDILVNSASLFERRPLQSITAEDWHNNLSVHVTAPFRLAQVLGPAMKRRGCGKIVNVTDAALHRLYTLHIPYFVSKAALSALTKTLALELAPEVQVNAVAPGTVLLAPGTSAATEDSILRRTPLCRIGTPEEIAKAVLYFVRDADFATGEELRVDGGFSVG